MDGHGRMTVGIVGLGYVGLPLAVAFAEAGCQVIGVDVSASRTEQLRRGESYVEDVPSRRLVASLERIELSTRVAPLARADAIVVCVSTPLTPNREPDLTALMDATREIAGVLTSGQLVAIESTTYPGATRERLVPVLEESGMVAGEDFHVAFSPQRVDPGRQDFTLRNTPKLVGGLTPGCAARAEELYRAVCDTIVPVSSPDHAEMAKLLENIFRSVNIALVNELGMLADRMDLDIYEVIDAAATKPFGFMRFEPGPGMGGHCLPVAPFYLSWKARERDMTAEFIERAGKVNQEMPYYSVEKVERALNDLGRSVKGSRVLILGVSYKAGIGDVRDSPALKMIGRLAAHGAHVAYHDAHVEELRGLGLRSVELEPALDAADIAVIVTAHPGIDFHAVASRVPTVDLRGVLRGPVPAKAPAVDTAHYAGVAA